MATCPCFLILISFFSLTLSPAVILSHESDLYSKPYQDVIPAKAGIQATGPVLNPWAAVKPSPEGDLDHIGGPRRALIPLYNPAFPLQGIRVFRPCRARFSYLPASRGVARGYLLARRWRRNTRFAFGSIIPRKTVTLSPAAISVRFPPGFCPWFRV